MEFPLKLQPSYNQILTPTNIAIFSSVGLHAVILGFMLPNLSEWSKSSQKGDQQNVGVIELNEAEQSRLPNTSPFSGENPFFPSTSALPNPLPNANPLPNDPLLSNPGLSLPPLPESLPPSTNYNSFSNQTPLPPLPSLPSYPPNLPPLSSYNNLNNIPITQSPPSLPRLPSSSDIPSRPSLSRLPTSADIPDRPSLPPFSNTQSYFDSLRGSQAKTPTRPKFGELPPSRGTDFITAAPQNLAGNTLPNLPGMLPQPQLQDDGQETTSEQAMRNDLQWRAKLQQNGTGNTDVGTLNLVGAYPPAACATRAEGRVVYNVLPSGEITQIQASRYSLFNELARQSFQSQRFTQPTRVIVNFNYDPKVCASTVTAPNLPGLPSGTPAIPPASNGSESVSPANNPNRNIPQIPTLVPGSNTPSNNSAPVNSQRNTIQNTLPNSPTRIPQSSSPVTPTIAPSPGSVPSEAPTTTTNPSTLKTPSQNSPPPQNTQNSSPESLKEPKTQTQPVEQPMVKPTSSVDTPKAPSEVKPASTPNVQSSPVPTNESLLEKIRKSLFQRQGTKNQEATPSKPTPSSTESQKPGNGSSGTMTNNTIGPSVGKKE